MTVPKSRERISGQKLQKGIIDLAHRYGFIAAHFTAVKTDYGWRVPVSADGRGFPDLIMVRERLIAVEVKGDGDTLRPDQKRWQAALRMANVEYHVFTPAMWVDGTIEAILSRRGTS